MWVKVCNFIVELGLKGVMISFTSDNYQNIKIFAIFNRVLNIYSDYGPFNITLFIVYLH